MTFLYYTFMTLAIISLLIIPVIWVIELIIEKSLWCRAIVFNKLRKKYETMDSFEITKSDHQFGYFYNAQPCKIIKAYNPEHALQRYLSFYKRKYKKYNELDKKEIYETSSRWGIYKVTNTRTKFSNYYH